MTNGGNPSGAEKQSGAVSQRYVVLARRYRPMRFAEVIGQEHVTRTLQNAIQARRIHHAYLFCGSRGVGKTTVARILARALNHPGEPVPDPPAPADAEREQQEAIDVIEIDGASHTGVDDVRELREGTKYLPARSRYRIYIIDEVHMLSTSAFNALLKTLEEPPPHVVFIFATTEPHKIPLTILSRCQRFDFRRVAVPVLVEYLERLAQAESIAIADAGLRTIARAAEGGVRDALSLLDQVVAYTAHEAAPISAEQVAEVLGLASRQVLFELSAAVIAKDLEKGLDIVARLHANGFDLVQFAFAFLAHLRDLSVVASVKQPRSLVEATDAEFEELSAQARLASPSAFQFFFERFFQVAEQANRSAAPRFLLEATFAELCSSQPVQPLGDLLERLEQLEARVAQRSPVKGGPPPTAGGSAGSTRKLAANGPGYRTAPSDPPALPTEERGPDEAQPDAMPDADADSRRAHSSGTEIFVRWKGFLGKVKGPLLGVLEGAHVVSWGAERVELAYPENSFELEKMADANARKNLEDQLAEYVGARVEVVVRALGRAEETDPSLAEFSLLREREHEQRERTRQLREEAQMHPLSLTLKQQFNATIQSIRLDQDR